MRIVPTSPDTQMRLGSQAFAATPSGMPVTKATTAPLSDALLGLLGNTYNLQHLASAASWNLQGAQDVSYSQMFGDIGRDANWSLQSIASAILVTGGTVPVSLATVLAGAAPVPATLPSDPIVLSAAVYKQLQSVLDVLNTCFALSEQASQAGVSDFLADRITAVQQFMLRTRASVQKDSGATKTEDGVDFPAAAYAYTPDKEKPSTWKLRLWETPEKKETAKQVGAAVAALGAGFRGNKVEIPTADRADVVATVRAAWQRLHPKEEVPSAISKALDAMDEMATDDAAGNPDDKRWGKGRFGEARTAHQATQRSGLAAPQQGIYDSHRQAGHDHETAMQMVRNPGK